MNNQNNTANSAVNVYNPLIEAAKPVLILANSMQQTTSQLSTDSLINKFSLLIIILKRMLKKMELNMMPFRLQNTVFVHL